MDKQDFENKASESIQNKSAYVNMRAMGMSNNNNIYAPKNNKNRRNNRKYKIIAGTAAASVAVIAVTVILIIAIGNMLQDNDSANKTYKVFKEEGSTSFVSENKEINGNTEKESKTTTEKNTTKTNSETKKDSQTNTNTEEKESGTNTTNMEKESGTSSVVQNDTKESQLSNADEKSTQSQTIASSEKAENNSTTETTAGKTTEYIIEGYFQISEEEPTTSEPLPEKDPRCNLDVTSEYYKYELAYRTKDTSALKGDELTFYNNLKQALDNAYKYKEQWYQEKEIHDWIVLNVSYDHDNYVKWTIPDISYSAEGVFINKKAVCDGYSKAFMLCMDILGIENKRVIGRVPTGEETSELHAWNMVKLEGEWYQIDCTFDDPVTSDGRDTGELHYNYFNVTDTMMQRNHTYTVTTPANGKKYSYYNYFYEGTVVHSFDEYYEELYKAINNGEKIFSVVHYDEDSAEGLVVLSEGNEYRDYIRIYNAIGRLVQCCVRARVSHQNFTQLEVELYEDKKYTDVAIGKEDYEKKLSEHMAAGEKNIKIYILDENYYEGKYSAEKDTIINGTAYILNGSFGSGQRWYTSWTDWNIIYCVEMELEYLDSRDNYYYAANMEEAKRIVQEHKDEAIKIYFETCNEDKINIKECIKGTAMEVLYSVYEKKKIVEYYTIVYLYGDYFNNIEVYP